MLQEVIVVADDIVHFGPVQLGVFVSSGVAGRTATATFDSIAIGASQMRYKTSWVGNTFGSREEDKHVSNAISAMWFAPDGTCYTSSYWDEGGRPVTSYRDGRAARGLPIGTPQTAEGAITGDAAHLFVAAVDGIIQLDPAKPDFAPQPLCLSVNLLDKEEKHSVVSGLASDGRRLYVADSRENLIRIVSVAPDLARKIEILDADGKRLFRLKVAPHNQRLSRAIERSRRRQVPRSVPRRTGSQGSPWQSRIRAPMPRGSSRRGTLSRRRD